MMVRVVGALLLLFTGSSALAQDAVTGQPSPAQRPARLTPLLQLGWRHLAIGHVGGAMAGATSMEAVALDFYPYSRYLRFGVSTEYAREHSSRQDADWYVAEHLSLGVQRPAIWTPFVEGSVGGGYLQRTVVGQQQPTALWEFGLSAGVLYHFAPPAFVSASLGWVHPVWLLVNPKVTSGDTSDLVRAVYTDALTFKLGLGF